MILVGSNTLGDKTDKCNTQDSNTKESGGGEVDRCDGTPDVLSVGRLEHLAPPPLSLFALIEPLTQQDEETSHPSSHRHQAPIPCQFTFHQIPPQPHLSSVTLQPIS